MTTQNNTARAFWALCYRTNSTSPRARKWYRAKRLIELDGKIWCVYWGPDDCASDNRTTAKDLALQKGIPLAPGLYTEAPYPHAGDQMVRVK